MGKDIVLVLPPPGWQRVFPVGLGFLASYLRKQGFSAVIYDMVMDMAGEVSGKDGEYLWGLKAKNIWLDSEILNLFIEKYEKKIQDCVDHILSFNARIVGFSIIHSKQLIALELIRRIKEKDPRVLIVAGGPACFYDEDRRILEEPKTIDIFVLGEGEETLSEVLRHIKKNKSLERLKGSRAAQTNYKYYAPRQTIKDLDSIPFPEYPGLKLENYYPNPIPLFWSRGCFGNCSFCEIKNVWISYRTRSAENIFKEIRWYAEEKNIFSFSIFDSLMNGRPQILEKVCDYIIQTKYPIHWEGNVVASPPMNERIYSKMKKAGCALVYFGIETGSKYISQKMKKPFTIFQAERNIRLAHDAGIEVSVNFITGFPGEDERYFQETLDFVQRNSKWIDRADFITECQVARGTDLFLHPSEYGIVIPPNWNGYRWYAQDGTNTVHMRQQKTIRLGKYLESLGVKINTNFNLDDGNRGIVDDIVSDLKKRGSFKRSAQLEQTSDGTPCVYLREGDKNFPSQIDRMREFVRKREVYHTVVGVSETNFLKLNDIYNLIRKIRKQTKLEFASFELKPLGNIKIRFYGYLDEINKYVRKEGLEFKIADARFDSLLTSLEADTKDKNPPS